MTLIPFDAVYSENVIECHYKNLPGLLDKLILRHQLYLSADQSGTINILLVCAAHGSDCWWIVHSKSEVEWHRTVSPNAVLEVTDSLLL